MVEVLAIVTCHNRKNLSLAFLRSLASQINLGEINLTTFLVDDGSTDGTSEAVKENFPKVKVFMGDGNLYWAGAVRKALLELKNQPKQFQGILIVNDDLELAENAVSQLVQTSLQFNAIVGSTVLSRGGEVEATGGRRGRMCKPRLRKVLANGEVQPCEFLPGHLMYIPMHHFIKLGGFSDKLRYGLIDLDFTFRASKESIPVLLTATPLAVTNHYHNNFKDISSLRGSWRSLLRKVWFHPKGPYWKDSINYLRLVSPYLWWFWLVFYYRAMFKAMLVSSLGIFKSIKQSNSFWYL